MATYDSALFNPMAAFDLSGGSFDSSNNFLPSPGGSTGSWGGGFGGGAPSSGSAGRPGFFSMDSFLGGKDPKTGENVGGWGSLALGAASALGSGFMAMKQYGLAKKQLAFQKDAFNKNYAAQRQTINTQLQDRQRARVASNPNDYMGVDSYMTQNRIV